MTKPKFFKYFMDNIQEQFFSRHAFISDWKTCEYCKSFKNSFFNRTPPVAASDNPTTVQ